MKLNRSTLMSMSTAGLAKAVCITAVLLMSSSFVLAQDVLPSKKPSLIDPNSLTGALGPLTLQPFDYNTPSCVCTNLGDVTVICEDCDRETDVDLCYTHDRACKDAAQKGGIREHATFFCTTLAE